MKKIKIVLIVSIICLGLSTPVLAGRGGNGGRAGNTSGRSGFSDQGCNNSSQEQCYDYSQEQNICPQYENRFEDQERFQIWNQQPERVRKENALISRHMRNQLFRHRFENLRKLREADPERFRRIMEEKRCQVRDRLQYLKQKNPKKYTQVMRRIHQTKLQRLRQLKQKNPQEFKRIMQKRRAYLQARLEQLKQEDPKRYERIKQNIECVREYHRLRKQDRVQAQAYLEHHPRVRNFMERCYGLKQ